MIQTSALLAEFDLCVEEGVLRHLGSAFARFMASLGDMPPCAILSCALVSELEGRGHSCLLLADLAADPCSLLGWTPPRWERMQQVVGTLPSTIAEWKKALSGCSQIWTVGTPDRNQPLVLDHDRLYLRRFWFDEHFIAKAVAERTAAPRDVDPARVHEWLERLFAGSHDDAHDWQKTACAIAARSALSIITGGPGTGKTYTVARLLTLLFALADHPERLRVAMAAPSGKAAVRLKQSIDHALKGLGPQVGGHIDLELLASRLTAASTLHSLLGFSPQTRSIRHDADNPLDVDVLIVDEASMVHLEMMADLLDALPPHAMLVLLGDKDQLSSVEAGAVLGDLCEGAQDGNYRQQTAAYVLQACGQALPAAMVKAGSPLAQQTVMLRQSRRFDGPIGQLALAVNAGDIDAVRACLAAQQDGHVRWSQQASTDELLQLAVAGRAGAEGGYRDYLQALAKRPPHGDQQAHAAWVATVLDAFDAFRILCAVRDGEWGVQGINQAVERRLEQATLIDRRGEWYAGRPVMVSRNDYGLGVYNGDVGIALPDATREGTLRVYFQSGDKLSSVLPTRLGHVDTAFAMTVHKVQGSEFRHTVLALPPDAGHIVVRELIYTGITRASKRFTLLTPVAGVLEQGIRRQTVRASGLQCFMNAV